jgi:hypothetical protein
MKTNQIARFLSIACLGLSTALASAQSSVSVDLTTCDVELCGWGDPVPVFFGLESVDTLTFQTPINATNTASVQVDVSLRVTAPDGTRFTGGSLGWSNFNCFTPENHQGPGLVSWDLSSFQLTGGTYMIEMDGWSDVLGPACMAFTVVADGTELSAVDCNGNGTADYQEIAAQPGLDADLNGILDSCEANGPFYVTCPLNGLLYEAISPRTWLESRAYAVNNNMHVAVSNTPEIANWIHGTFRGPSYWIGYTDAAQEGTFLWANGAPVGYENWAPGAPTALQPDQDFVAVDGTNGSWDTYFSTTTFRAILQAQAADCNGNSIPDDQEIAQDPTLDWNGDGVMDACSPPNYCTGGVNSSGLTGVMSVSGSPVVADNDLTLCASQMPPNQWSFFLMSQSQANVPGFGGSQGVLCLGPPIVRFDRAALGEIQKTTLQGTRCLDVDLTNLPQNVVFDIGSTWNFQLWCRDQNPTNTSNTSDGFEVLFR